MALLSKINRTKFESKSQLGIQNQPHLKGMIVTANAWTSTAAPEIITLKCGPTGAYKPGKKNVKPKQ